MRGALLLLAFVAGCACPDHVELDAKWLPLRRIEQDPTIPSGLYVTRRDVMLTRDLCDWLAHDGVDQHSVLVHEQHHAIEQDRAGLTSYSLRYDNDLAFRDEQEREATALQIHDLVKHGRAVDVDRIARMFAEVYRTETYEAAREWALGEVRAAH